MAHTERTGPVVVVVTIGPVEQAPPACSLLDAIRKTVPPGTEVTIRTEPWQDGTVEVEGSVYGVAVRGRLPSSLLSRRGPFPMPQSAVRPVRDSKGNDLPQ